MIRSIFSFITLLILVFSTSLAGAAASQAETVAAAALAQKGQRAMEQKEYAKAAEHFERAEARAHSPTHLVAWGKALVALGAPAKAYEKFAQVAHEGVQANSPRTWHHALAEARAEVDRLKPQLSWITVTVSGPLEPQVLIDNEKLLPTELGVRRPVMPGKRTVSVTAPGFVAERRTITLSEGSEQSIDFVLRNTDKRATEPDSAESGMQPAARYDATDAPENDMVEDEARRTRRRLTYVAFGIGGVGLLTGGVFGVLALNKRADLESKCGSDGKCPFNERSTLDEYHTLGTISGVGIAFALAGAGTGLGLLLTEPSDSAARTKQSFQYAPYVGFGTVGARGRF